MNAVQLVVLMFDSKNVHPKSWGPRVADLADAPAALIVDIGAGTWSFPTACGPAQTRGVWKIGMPREVLHAWDRDEVIGVFDRRNIRHLQAMVAAWHRIPGCR